MFAVFVTFEVQPENFRAFVARTKIQAEDSLAKEADCHVFDVWTDSQRANIVQLYEVYGDAGGFADHLKTDHFKDFDGEVSAMIVNKQVLTFDKKI